MTGPAPFVGRPNEERRMTAEDRIKELEQQIARLEQELRENDRLIESAWAERDRETEYAVAAEARCARLQHAVKRGINQLQGTIPREEVAAMLREALGLDTPTHRKQNVEYWRARSRVAVAECARLQRAIAWALGEGDSDFYSEHARKERGLPIYWWRTKLRALAGLDTPADSQPLVECDGGPYCQAVRHVHGCLADKGDCDHPSEHADSQPEDGTA